MDNYVFKEVASNNPRRDFNILTYYPAEVFIPVFEKYGKYLYILHNKDDKQEHYHVAFKSKNIVTLDRLHDLVDCEYSKYCDRLGIEYKRQRMTAYPLREESIETAIDYYLHTNEDSVTLGKHKYYLSEIRANYDFIEKYKKFKSYKEEQQSNETFFFDLVKNYENESVMLTYLAKKYGRDFIKNFHKYLEFRVELKAKELEAKIISDLDNLSEPLDEYVFVENSQNFQTVEAYRQDLQRKLDKLYKLYPNPEFKIMKGELK